MSATMTATPARWEAYAPASRADHFAWWCEQHCVLSIDRFAGRPLVLEDWQLQMMGEALAELGEDEAYWTTVALIIPKKNAKTTLLAAASDKQAGRLFRAAGAFVRNDPWLAGQVVVREHEGEIARADGRGVLYRVSADSGALSGYDPSLVVADELADWRTPRRRRAWSMLATGGVARKQVHVFGISTAGEPAERVEGILGQMIDRNELDGDVERVHRALQISRNHPARTLIYNYDAQTRDPLDLDAIKAANPASWITRERLAELAATPTLTPGQFLQLHGCVWTASQGAFLELETWRSFARPARVQRDDEVVLGFRGADTATLVACRRADGLLDLVDTWEPGLDELVDTDEADDVFASTIAGLRVAGLFCSYTPAWATVVDGWRHQMGKRNVVDVDVSVPSARTAQITERFRADALAGRVQHTGNPRLDRHIVAARLARHRNLPHLVSDVRGGAPVSGALACLLAWEGRTLLGPDGGTKPGRLIFS